MKAVILAAGMGSRLLPLTADRPKPLVPVAGRPLLFHTLDRLSAAGIAGSDVVVVAGYREDVLRTTLANANYRPTVVANAHYADWNNFWSLYVAREAVGGDAFLQIDGDLLFDDRLLPRLLAAPGPAALAVDVRPGVDDEAMKVRTGGPDGHIVAFSKALDPVTALGESLGIARIDPPLGSKVFAALKVLADEGLTNEYYEAAYQRLADAGEGPFRSVNVHDCVAVEIDDHDDLVRAEALLGPTLRATR